MLWIMMLPVSVLLFRAVYTDVKNGIIENRLMFAGLIAGLLFSVLSGGGRQFLESIKYTALMFASLIFLYLLKGIGAGDVKLLCVLAAFFRKDGFGIVAAAFFIAAVIAVVKMLLRVLKKEKIFQRGETICFSIPVSLATFLIFLTEVDLCIL